MFYNYDMEDRKIDANYFKVDEDIKQNEINDILTSGEEVLLTLKPARNIYLLESITKGLPITLIWAGFDIFFIYMMVSTGTLANNPGMIAFIVVFFALHLLPVWIFLSNVVKKMIGYKNLTYAFTDRRIIIRSGVIGIDFKYIYYSAIDTVDVKVGILDRIFKVGDVVIKGPGQSCVLDDIKTPYSYSTKIQEIVRDLKADMAFPNDLRPEENHGYNTKYKK